MKAVLRVYILVMIAVLSMACGGCKDKVSSPEPVNFITANPPNNSSIQPNETITVLFDLSLNSDDIAVYPGTVEKIDGQKVIIRGPFPIGALSLIITWRDRRSGRRDHDSVLWRDNLYVLNYTVIEAQKNDPTDMKANPTDENQTEDRSD